MIKKRDSPDMNPLRSHPLPFSPTNAAEKCNVVILYDRIASISKASATYLQLTHDLGDEFSPDFRLWRVDLTLESDYCVEAERDFAEADVIIVAVNGREKCPPEFQRWRDGAGHEGGAAPHGVIALVDDSDESEAAAETWSGLLHHVGAPINPEIFVCDEAERR